MLKFFLDELTAQMAEGRYMTFRELGSFRALPGKTPDTVKVDFAPSKFLVDGIKERRARKST